MGHVFRFMASLELGDAPTRDRRWRPPHAPPARAQGAWVIAFYHASWTLTTGRLEQAEQEAIAADGVGQRSSVDQSILVSGLTGQLASIRILQGRLGELRGPLVELARSTALPGRLAGRSRQAALRSGTLRRGANGVRRGRRGSSASGLRSTTVGQRARSAVGGRLRLDERAAARGALRPVAPVRGHDDLEHREHDGSVRSCARPARRRHGTRAQAERRLRAAVRSASEWAPQAFLAIARHELAAVVRGPERRELAATARAAADRLGVALPDRYLDRAR